MLGLTKPKVIEEYQARGETEQIFYELRQTLRSTGVPLIFRCWATHEAFFEQLWQSVHANLETLQFEQLADSLRADAVQLAEPLGPLNAIVGLTLGESQRYHVRSSLDAYRYVNPKVLLLVSAVGHALRETVLGTEITAPEVEWIERGAPGHMLPMELGPEKPKEPRARRLLRDIQKTFNLEPLHDEYRTLSLWPDYLEPAWTQLKSVLRKQEYQRAVGQLSESARQLAQQLPNPVPLSRAQLEQLGERADEILATTERFECYLPQTLLNITLFSLDWNTPEELRRSPFPPATRQAYLQGI